MSQRLVHKKTRLAGNISQKTTLMSYNVIWPTDGVRASDKQKVTIVFGVVKYPSQQGDELCDTPR